MGHAALLAAHAKGIASLTLSPKPHFGLDKYAISRCSCSLNAEGS